MNFLMRFFNRYVAACMAIMLSASAFAGEVFLETFRSEALGRDYKYTIYLPDSYKNDSKNTPSCTCCMARGVTKTNGLPRAACVKPWMQ